MRTWTSHNHHKKNHPIKKTGYTYVRLKDVFRLLFTTVDVWKKIHHLFTVSLQQNKFYSCTFKPLH